MEYDMLVKGKMGVQYQLPDEMFRLHLPGLPGEDIDYTFPNDGSKSCSPAGAEPQGPSFDSAHLNDLPPTPKHEHSTPVVDLVALIGWPRTLHLPQQLAYSSRACVRGLNCHLLRRNLRHSPNLSLRSHGDRARTIRHLYACNLSATIL